MEYALFVPSHDRPSVYYDNVPAAVECPATWVDPKLGSFSLTRMPEASARPDLVRFWIQRTDQPKGWWNTLLVPCTVPTGTPYVVHVGPSGSKNGTPPPGKVVVGHRGRGTST